ncbi:MAG: hypothetical protein AAB254_01865 [candidate division NC10 bacterium]|jgi:hypothetical protein
MTRIQALVFPVQNYVLLLPDRLRESDVTELEVRVIWNGRREDP